MSEIQNILRQIHGFHPLGKLGDMRRVESELHPIDCWDLMFTCGGNLQFAVIAFCELLIAIGISQHTESQFHVILCRISGLKMIVKYPKILVRPERMALVAADLVIPGARDLFFFMKNQLQFLQFLLLKPSHFTYFHGYRHTAKLGFFHASGKVVNIWVLTGRFT